MDIKTAFRTGFLKKAVNAGFTEEEASQAYEGSINKLAYNDMPLSSDDASDFKDELRGQGMPPVMSGPEQGFPAVNYNQHLISERDRLARQNPDVASARGALMGGGAGAAIGGLAGHLGGHSITSRLNPSSFKPGFMTKMPVWARTGGMLAGALAGGVPAAMNARHKVDIAHKLEDPRNLESLIKQLSQERQLANNNFY